MSASDLAQKRAFTAWASRVQMQFDRKRLYEQTEQPALAAEGGKIKPLGAAGAIRPRGNISSGAQPVGTPVSQSQGLINSPQAASTDDSGLKALEQSLGKVAVERGLLPVEGNPNDPAGDGSEPAVVNRYPWDRAIDTTTGTLYGWKPGTEDEAGEWIALSGAKEELNGLIEEPEVKSYPLIHSARYRTRVVQLLYSGSGTTAALSVVNGTVIEVGGSLNLVVSAAGSSEVAFTVELERA